MSKVYVKYARPYRDDNDQPPVQEVWSHGERPKKKEADGITLMVYDLVDGIVINERIWDGAE